VSPRAWVTSLLWRARLRLMAEPEIVPALWIVSVGVAGAILAVTLIVVWGHG
jgi:hypothetical protein